MINDCLCSQCSNFKVSELVLRKKHTVSIKSCCNFKKYIFVLLNATAESLNCSVFLKNVKKKFLQFDVQKKKISPLELIEKLPQHLSQNFSAMIRRLSILLVRN